MRRFPLPHLFAIFLIFGCAEPPPPPPDSPVEPMSAALVEETAACTLLMGWDPWEPYQYQDVDGNLRGLDVELVKAIATIAECDVSFVEGRWGTLMQRLQKGEVDMLTGATRNAARESFAWFSQPYRPETFTLYVRQGEAQKFPFATVAQLMQSDFKLGVTEQYTYGDNVSALQEDPMLADKFVGATVGELNYARLLDFEIDGFLDDPFVAARAFRARNLHDQIIAHPIEINSGDVNLMFSKVSVTAGTLERIDDAIRILKADGRHQAIIDKYLD